MPGQTPTPATGLQDASWDDVIRAAARQHGVNPALALAVARKESNKTPGAIGDGGLAVGMFQLHDAAAQDVNVDRNDPIQNITGGVKYLKLLSDRYQGDVNKTLMAYNGGMDNVDRNTISPQAQAYATEVMTLLSQELRGGGKPGAATPGATPGAVPSPTNVRVLPGGGQAPIAGRGTGSTNIGTTAQANAYQFGQAFDPRTAEGRNNIAATAGEIGIGFATKGLPLGSIGTKIVQVLAPALGAGSAATAERALEGTGDAMQTGGKQGAASIAGAGLMWPIRRIGRALAAGPIARAAEAGLKAETTAVKETGRSVVQSVQNEVDIARQMLRTSGNRAIRATAADAVEHTAKAKRFAAERLADVEAKSAEEIGAITKQYDSLLAHVPSQLQGGKDVAAVVRGAGRPAPPAVQGAAKKALDIAGQRVAEAAETGPAINIQPLREKVDEMIGQFRPSVMFPTPVEAGQGVMVGGRMFTPAQAQSTFGSAPSPGAQKLLDEYTKYAAQKLGVPETHPLPGLLGKFMAIPPTTQEIAFKDAHQIKMLLDSAVNWDKTAKNHIGKMTKGLRTALREQMTGHADYDAATAAYQAVIPLYKQGVGLKLIKLADSPDGLSKIAGMLTNADASQAMTLRQLLIDQSTAGGDPLAGQRAWNAVRANYTFDNIIAGGMAGLPKRLESLVTLKPEFVRTVFGDTTGQNVLKNLGALAEAYTQAQSALAKETAATKLAGAAGVDEAKAVGAAATNSLKDRVGEQLTEATRQGKSRVQTARRIAQEQNTAQSLKNTKFAASSLHPYATRTALTESADVLVAGAAGLHSLWGARAALRLMQSPKAADLVEYAAYSNQKTRVLVDLLTKPGITPQVGSAMMRELSGAFGLSPVASHPVAAATPAPAASHAVDQPMGEQVRIPGTQSVGTRSTGQR